MTNLEFIKTLKSGEEIFNFLEHNHNGYKDTKAISIHKAIEIVKAGVKDENRN